MITEAKFPANTNDSKENHELPETGEIKQLLLAIGSIVLISTFWWFAQ